MPEAASEDVNRAGSRVIQNDSPNNSSIAVPGFREPADTTFTLIKNQAARRSDNDALVYLEDGTVGGGARTHTYRDLLHDVTQAANAFRRAGIGRTDVVSLLMPTLPETQIALWAAQAAGIVNPVNSYLTIDQIAYILQSAQTRILVTQGPSSGELWAKIEALEQMVPTISMIVTVDPDPPRGVHWGEFIAGASGDDLDFAPPVGQDIAAFFHTGGTTGFPKLAKHTHLNETFDAQAIAQSLKWDDLRGLILGIPLFHTAGAIYCSLAAFASGLTVVMLGQQGYRNARAVQGIWDTIEQYQVDFLPALPAVMPAMLEALNSRERTPHLKLTAVGSTQVPAPLLREWSEATGLEPVTGWGLTEATCQSTMTPPQLARKPGSVGTPLQGCEVRIVTHEEASEADLTLRRDCAPGEVGLILTRGPNVFPGYVDPSHDQDVLLPKGWLNTGDLGHVDEDGDLWIVGRAKDLIKRGGHGIDPANVEETLNTHPQVLSSAVVGRPDVYAGELPIAYVQLRSDTDVFVPETVVAWCKHRTADPAAAPVEIVVVDQLPLTAVGKISKVALRWDAARRAIEREVNAALAAPTVEFDFELTDLANKYTGTLSVAHASQRSLDLLRRRLDLLPVPNTVQINATAVPPEVHSPNRSNDGGSGEPGDRTIAAEHDIRNERTEMSQIREGGITR